MAMIHSTTLPGAPPATTRAVAAADRRRAEEARQQLFRRAALGWDSGLTGLRNLLATLNNGLAATAASPHILGPRQVETGTRAGQEHPAPAASMPQHEARAAPPTTTKITVSLTVPPTQAAPAAPNRLGYVALGQMLCLLACAAAILSLRRGLRPNHGAVRQAFSMTQQLLRHLIRRPAAPPSNGQAPAQRASFNGPEDRGCRIHKPQAPRSTLISDDQDDQPASHQDLLDRLIEMCRELGVASLPEMARGRWELGLACVTGPVRPHNEDSAVAFRIGDCSVVIVADGCGGHPMGGSASRWAVTAAALSIVRSLNSGSGAMSRWEQAAATRAVFDASRLLGEAGRTLGLLRREKPGLRTTLITVVATPAAAGYAYIGDGGGVLLRSSGQIERFLEPQKGESLNVLRASLGPEMDGGPVSGTLARQEGDLLIVGTDGVFDRAAPAFAQDLMGAALGQFDGNLQALCDCVLEELGQQTDAAGPICDDNMTLGILGSGHRPVLHRGFQPGAQPEDNGKGNGATDTAACGSPENLDVH